MGAKTCDICHGMCHLPSGRYESCSSCGGRGYGASTDTSCMACGGSGQSTTEIQDQCWNCNGVGTVTVSDDQKFNPNKTPSKSSAKSTVRNKTSNQTGNASTRKSNETLSETIGGISLLIACVAGFIFYQDEPELGPALGVAFVFFILSGIVLYISYYAIKIAIEIIKVIFFIAFLGVIILFVSNMLGFEWAVSIVNSL
tara:strand:+ start:15 stop:611 length:597 start_codon:yes stop_codon:yes gene_type:complete